MTSTHSDPFIEVFQLKEDASKPGRILSSVRIGNVYMSRLVIRPGVTTGNYYHKDTRLMFYVERGRVLGCFEHVKTHEREEFYLDAGKRVIHVPSCVAHATKNISEEEDAVLVFFSDKELRSEDCYSHILLS